MIFLEKSDLIVNNKSAFISLLEETDRDFKFKYDWSTVEKYSSYNIFQATSPSSVMYSLLSEVKSHIHKYIGQQDLWIQAWLNVNQYPKLIIEHKHSFPWHGYITIDPKQTKTVFENFEIKNEPGQIYFGRGDILHKVVATEPFEGNRLTIGFDVTNIPDVKTNVEGFIPLF
jgi:hypothetical protein